MELLYKREQKKSVWTHRVTFKLWAKVELTDEERQLINTYNMDQSMLVPVPQPGLFRSAVFVTLLSFVSIYVFLSFFGSSVLGLRLGWLTAIALSLLAGLLVGMVYYHQMRETIYVKDLIHGRYFRCPSVIELARKEAFLEAVTGYFRQVLESAKNWDGTEKLPIKPLPPEEAKKFILSGPLL